MGFGKVDQSDMFNVSPNVTLWCQE